MDTSLTNSRIGYTSLAGHEHNEPILKSHDTQVLTRPSRPARPARTLGESGTPVSHHGKGHTCFLVVALKGVNKCVESRREATYLQGSLVGRSG